jgi:hypothetical protein
MVIVVASLAYVLGYRRAVHPALMLAIAVISGFVVYYVTLNVFNLSSHAMILSNFWFYHKRPISIVSQVYVGLIIGTFCAVVSLVGFFNVDFEEATVRFFGGLFRGTLLLGVAWSVVAFSQFVPGFGFGPWWYTSLYAATVGLLGGTGLGVSCFVWWQALFGKEGDLKYQKNN